MAQRSWTYETISQCWDYWSNSIGYQSPLTYIGRRFMTSFFRKWLPPTLAVFLGITLLYLALRGVDFESLWADLRAGNYLWVIPFIVVTLLSHLIRAWRWRILLEALPEHDTSRPIPLRLTFASVMIGFMANYAAPRLGEVVRSSHIALRQKMRFGGVFGTVIADRVLDVVVLAVLLLTLPLVLGDRLSSLFQLIGGAFESISSAVLLLVIAALVVIGGAALFMLTRKPKNSQEGQSFLGKLISAFRDGLVALLRSKRKAAILLSTIAMWGCYLIMTYLPLEIFGLSGSGGLNMIDAWALLLIGALGIVVPSPGGVGSYHFLAIQSLIILWGVSQEAAASYAIFTHAAQMILYTAVGFLFVLIEGATWRELKSVPEEIQPNESPT